MLGPKFGVNTVINMCVFTRYTRSVIIRRMQSRYHLPTISYLSTCGNRQANTEREKCSEAVLCMVLVHQPPSVCHSLYRKASEGGQITKPVGSI